MTWRPARLPPLASLGVVPGIAAAGARTAGRLPGLVLRVSLRGLGQAAGLVGTLREEYAGLAARWRDEAGTTGPGGPAAGPPERAPDEPVAAWAEDPAEEWAPTPPAAADTVAADTVAADLGAPGTAGLAADRAERQVHAAGVPSGATLGHDELPLADFDHLTLGSLRGRLRRLGLDDLVQLRDYERAHGNRLPIVTMLENRIAKLQTDAGTSDGPAG